MPGAAISATIGTTVRATVRAAIGTAVSATVRATIGAAVVSAWYARRATVCGAFGTTISATIRTAVGTAVRGAFGTTISATVCRALLLVWILLWIRHASSRESNASTRAIISRTARDHHIHMGQLWEQLGRI
ncbi:conserved membrane hypothetical protein [Arthrobacter sp. 9V]|uniref:hypothetical protein n=1 Tax=Arthrobacter sp. 9V TaxID=2653132 RepID=UPI0012F35348|nr:hypothetical protein [Arthrobacter sp. 9V]VXC32193.1 conserved membrane hypothetical protein [Arthrobacter sp. 9V]